MKYNAKQLNNGKWAVFCGTKKYFTNTVGCKEYAIEKAIELSMLYYQKQRDDMIQLLLDNAERDGRSNYESIKLVEPDGSTTQEYINISDMLC